MNVYSVTSGMAVGEFGHARARVFILAQGCGQVNSFGLVVLLNLFVHNYRGALNNL